MADIARIAVVYDGATDREFARLSGDVLGEMEFELTVDLLYRYIAPTARVADIGSGPGRYAAYLLRRGCRVGLVDLSAKNLERFRAWQGDTYGDRVLFTRVGCATELAGLATASFDAALVMGPLYHLTTLPERRAAVSEAHRILRPGGHVVASFISPYPRLKGLLGADGKDLRDANYTASLVAGGTTHTTAAGIRLAQHRCWPHPARALMEEGGFNTVCVRNLQGIACGLTDQEKALLADAGHWEAYFQVLRQTCENPDLLGATIHFAYVGRRT
jgi:SAM-dependent methyltransferase